MVGYIVAGALGILWQGCWVYCDLGCLCFVYGLYGNRVLFVVFRVILWDGSFSFEALG